MKFFISYPRDDSEWVNYFCEKLESKDKHDIWIDKNIPLGADWWKKILDEIEKCECLIYILTPQSVTSKYCRAEVNYALALNKPILPIMLTTCRFPRNLKRIQYKSVTAYPDIEGLIADIETSLQHIIANPAQYQAQSAPRPPYPEELSWRDLPITDFSIPQEKLECITQEETLAEAYGRFVQANFKYRHLLVTETGTPDGKLEGMIGLRQILKLQKPGQIVLPHVLIREKMDVYNSILKENPPTFVCIHQDDTLEQALRGAFLRRAIKAPATGRHFYFSAIPITDDDDKPVGVVSFKDILREMDQGIIPIPDETVGHYMQHREYIFASNMDMQPKHIRPDLGATGQRDVPVVDKDSPNRLLGYVPDYKLLVNLNTSKTMGEIMSLTADLDETVELPQEKTSLRTLLRTYLRYGVAVLYYEIPVVEKHTKYYTLKGLIGYRDIFRALLDS